MTHPSPIPLFAPDSPVPLVLLTYLLDSILLIFPGFTHASPARQAELRQAAMLMLDAFHPRDSAQAMLAASAVSAQVHAAECMRLAADPDFEPKIARRYTALGTSLLRCKEQSLRHLHRAQAPQRMAEEIPAWRTMPPPAPQPEQAPRAQAAPERPAAPPSPAARQQPMPSGTPLAARQHPMPSGTPLVQASSRPPAVTPDPFLPPPHVQAAGAPTRGAIRMLDPGEPKALKIVAQAAAKAAIAEAMQRGARPMT